LDEWNCLTPYIRPFFAILVHLPQIKGVFVACELFIIL